MHKGILPRVIRRNASHLSRVYLTGIICSLLTWPPLNVDEVHSNSAMKRINTWGGGVAVGGVVRDKNLPIHTHTRTHTYCLS